MRKISILVPEAICTAAQALLADYRRRHEGVDLDAVLALAVDMGIEQLAARTGFPPRLAQYIQRRRSGPAS